MKLIDTDTINYILESKKSFSEECIVTPDVYEEMLVAEIVHHKKVPLSIKQLIYELEYDEASYLRGYFYALNKYNKRSFFNMKGFGDVSIIAAVYGIIDSRKNKPTTLPLLGLSHDLEVYTGDVNLTKFLKTEFNGDIEIFSKTDI